MYHGSILERDWSDGDLVFANSTCFDDELMDLMSKKVCGGVAVGVGVGVGEWVRACVGGWVGVNLHTYALVVGAGTCG